MFLVKQSSAFCIFYCPKSPKNNTLEQYVVVKHLTLVEFKAKTCLILAHFVTVKNPNLVTRIDF